MEHLDTILQPYINVEPGRGNPRRDFELQEATISDSRYLDGLSIVVEAPEAGSLNIGTPVLFRGIEVGTVTGMTLGSLSDRVMIAMRISQRYQHLVRNNSVFWLASGYSLDFGLTGGVVKTGTFNQFIRGGIAFATPPGTPLAPEGAGGVNTSCCWKANRKSGANGAPPCHVNSPAPACSRRSIYATLRACFIAGGYPSGSTRCLFP
ncbi:paraquat-inducible protein B [Citrobacter koseri]|uniref:Paraquat-inducible protein B n=1 Tax=Citrobacter koseri TaxID=545 RepID=A0A2X2VM42_CITKO|nr:paraquat-inducible protein B [Citrobacter koseri]